ncbi:MAG: class E sortase [Clostridiales bacterium]|nr:class E sortase [Clostridiales bacterium]
MSTKRKLLFAAFCCLIIAGGVITFLNLSPLFRDESNRPVPPPPLPQVQANEEPPPVVSVPDGEVDASPDEEQGLDLPTGKLLITKERQGYVDMSLTLGIPVLNLVCPVYEGTDAEALSKMGACLYDYAQLPGRGNRNTSLAGHRNTRRNGVITDKAPFYYVDLMKEGDYLYLYDEDLIYRYLWEYTEVVEQDDWSMIRTAGYSCITITSCHPIGISDHRIVVRGALDEIFPYSEGFLYQASER